MADALKLVLEQALDTKPLDPPFGPQLFAEIVDRIIAKLYDDVEGGDNQWLANALELDLRFIQYTISRLRAYGAVFIYYERQSTGVSARWRLTGNTWMEEASRREIAERDSDV